MRKRSCDNPWSEKSPHVRLGVVQYIKKCLSPSGVFPSSTGVSFPLIVSFLPVFLFSFRCLFSFGHCFPSFFYILVFLFLLVLFTFWSSSGPVFLLFERFLFFRCFFNFMCFFSFSCFFFFRYFFPTDALLLLMFFSSDLFVFTSGDSFRLGVYFPSALRFLLMFFSFRCIFSFWSSFPPDVLFPSVVYFLLMLLFFWSSFSIRCYFL